MLERFVAGIVGGPFGVRGHCRVSVPSGDTRGLSALSCVVLRKDGVERKYEVQESSGAASSFVMKFKGIDTPEDAKLLSGREIVVSRAEAAPLDEGEFYVEDLRGLAVVHEGRKVAELVDVLEGGGGQLAELELPGGERRLVPFRDEFFGAVDPAARTAELRGTWILE